MPESQETQAPDGLQENKAVSVLETNDKVFKPSVSDLDKLLAQIVNLSDNSIYSEPTCSICCAPCREEVEQVLLGTNSDYPKAKQLLKDRCGIEVSSIQLENHMSNHAVRGIQELQKLEYLKKMKRLSGSRSSTLEKIELGSNVLLDRIISVNSLTPSSTDSVSKIEQIKSGETSKLTGVLSRLLQLQAEIMGEMKSSGELITVPRDGFTNLVNETIIAAKTEGERALVKGFFTKLMHLNKGG